MFKFKELTVYKKAFILAMDIFEVSKQFPSEEKFALTSQIRRSSRSVCSSIAEAYRKRLYEAYFINKSTDADMENSETMVWTDFAISCRYINNEKYSYWKNEIEEIGKLLNHMITHPEKYVRQSEKQMVKTIDSKQ